MQKKTKVAIIVTLVIVFSVVSAQVGWTNTAQPGSENDPLISKSYLDNILSVFRSDVEESLNNQEEKINELTVKYNDLKNELNNIKANGDAPVSEDTDSNSNDDPQQDNSSQHSAGNVVVDAGTVNFRSGGGTSYSRVATVSRNDVIKAIKYEDRWIKGSINGETGWIAAWLVQPQSGHDLEYINAGTVNVRQGPGTNHSRITTVSRGDIVRIVDSNGDWNKVILNDGTSAWIYAPLSNDIQF
ncbi:SH3 domain-containing protein [Proteinivorax tanatarense]|uniref:SH3 domain-containing protein n=1 Tax=Proteinivorax tanatarense TaxID=1260629 RepID=A0AAU7VIW1_9FIRM